MSELNDDFDPVLKRAFALADEPAADDAFTAAVATRVEGVERRARLGVGARAFAMGVAGAAGAFGVWTAVQAILPSLQAAMGPEILMLLTAQAPNLSLGLPLMLMLGAAAGAGASLLARSSTE